MEQDKSLPPTYLFVSIIAIIALHFLFPLMRLIALPWKLIGIIPLGIGIILNLVADQAFKRLGTTVKPYEKSSAFIKNGVFQISRHPMYLGMILILIGISILLGSLTPFFVVVVFAIIMERVFIQVEERMMEETFGDEYLEYRANVRKWL